MKRGLCAALLALPFLIAPLHASVLAGETIDVNYYFPDTGSLNESHSGLVVPTVINFFDTFNLTVNDTTIVADSFGCCHWTPADFNGWILTVTSASPITSVDIDPSTDLAGFGPANLSFTSNTITVNWQDLPTSGEFYEGMRLQLNINGEAAEAPEPGSWALIGFGLVGVATLRRRFARARVN